MLGTLSLQVYTAQQHNALNRSSTADTYCFEATCSSEGMDSLISLITCRNDIGGALTHLNRTVDQIVK